MRPAGHSGWTGLGTRLVAGIPERAYKAEVKGFRARMTVVPGQSGGNVVNKTASQEPRSGALQGILRHQSGRDEDLFSSLIPHRFLR